MWRAALACLFWAGPVLSQEAVLSADYIEPVARYGHNVLGDTPEWGALAISVDTCPDCAAPRSETRIFRLPDTAIFEDVAPLVIDLNGDGAPEVIVVESDLSQGARMAVYGPSGRIAATPYIGTRFRWLAPVGATDLDGDGFTEIAYVDRPHLARVLRIVRFRDGALEPVAEVAGVTNHRIGESIFESGIRDCAGSPEVVAANADWTRIIAVRLQGGAAQVRDIGPYTGLESLLVALDCGG